MCAVDCPYGAIEMVERTDGKRHKYIAIEDPDRCVSCGICVGSCDVVAVTLGEMPPENLWLDVSTRVSRAKAKYHDRSLNVLFTCERHAAHGAAPFLEETYVKDEETAVEVIALPCVGTMPPDLLGRTIIAGAAEVKIVGCPADDCTNREGNLWTEQRLVRERVPRLRKPYANAPIFAYWVPPDDFNFAFKSTALGQDITVQESETQENLEQRRIFKDINWRNYLVAFALLAAIMVLQVLITDIPFTRYEDPQAMTQAVVADLAEPIDPTGYISTILGPELELRLQVDDQVVFSEMYETAELLSADSTPFYFEHELTPGQHQVRLAFIDDSNGITFILADELALLEAGQIFRYGH